MKNKQYPPRGGPPLVYRSRGTPGFGTRVFLTAHLFRTRVFLTAHLFRTRVFHHRYPLRDPTAYLKIRSARTEEDVGPPGWQFVQTLTGLKDAVRFNDVSTSVGLHVHSVAVGFSEGMAMPGQRIKDAYSGAGLQPHSTMRLKPEELVCPALNRQLKQTAMGEKQTELIKVQMAIQQIKMEKLPGGKNLQGFGNPEGLKTRNKAREPAGHPLGKMYRSDTGAEGAREGMRVFHREYLLRGPTALSNPAGLHVYRNEWQEIYSTPAGWNEVEIPTSSGVAHQSLSWYFYKHFMPVCSADRPLASGITGNSRLWMKAEYDETLKEAA